MISLIVTVAGRFGFNPKEAERFTKFLFVGTWGFVVDFGTLTLLVEVFEVPRLVAENTQFSATAGLILANTISFTLAVISNFTLNRYWTYPESRSKRKRIQLPQFALILQLLPEPHLFPLCQQNQRVHRYAPVSGWNNR